MGGQEKERSERRASYSQEILKGVKILVLAQVCVLSDQLEKSKVMVKRRESGA